MKQFKIGATDADCQNVKFNQLAVFNSGNKFADRKAFNLRR